MATPRLDTMPHAAAESRSLSPEAVVALSVHFEFLRKRHPDLADLGGLAERYASADPQSALLKLRTFAERGVDVVFAEYALPTTLDGGNLNDRLNAQVFRDLAPTVILDKLHVLRRRGNRAAHANEGTAATAIAALRDAFDVGRWLYAFVDDGNVGGIKPFDPASLPVEDSKTQLQRERKSLREQLAQQEFLVTDLMQRLDGERAARQSAEATVIELEEYRQRATAAASILLLNERDTRRQLIDVMLAEAGWDVGANGADSAQVLQEVKLSLVPDENGNGFADYVLLGEDGKALAVVEAKRTAKDPAAGATQAWLYANALERKYGKRPVRFWTNGVEVWFCDDVAPASQPRKLFGFYSKASLDYVVFQRSQHADGQQLIATPTKDVICDRIYQKEAIKAVAESFALGHRKALLVLATGTGKTRVVVAIADVMMRANWAKRILFLCDRKELRKQADEAFNEFLPDAPRAIVSRATAGDRDQRIYMATYPAMDRCYRAFDVGFFDLIIADESHRSIYNRYSDLLKWFDAMQIGLTATPREVVSHDTFALFGCNGRDPTYEYTYQQAIAAVPPYLVPFRVIAHTTQFLRQGIRFAELSDDDKRKWEAQDPDAATGALDVAQQNLDRQVLSVDTTRVILRNLMERGIRDASGSRPGKTIVFARSHDHAVLLARTFGDLFPQYGGDFCQVVDSHDERAETLLTRFKDPTDNLTVAISVDMLDTGVDVPQVVNLVFAKPLRSFVKFWQMIGRGTRLCPNLFGPGNDKKEFLIFDHWGNFEWFGVERRETDDPPPKSLCQQLFEARLELAHAALDRFDQAAFDSTADLLHEDLVALNRTRSIRVVERFRDLNPLCNRQRVQQFDAATVAQIRLVAAPLMGELDARKDEPALRFDLLVAQTQLAAITQAPRLATLAARVQDDVQRLPKNLAPVKAQAATIQQARAAAFWQAPTFGELEAVRGNLRGLLQYRVAAVSTRAVTTKVVDFVDGDEMHAEIVPTLAGQELVAYRQRVKEVLDQRLAGDPAIVKIRNGQAVTEGELGGLALQVQRIDPLIDLLKLPRQLHMHVDLARVLRGLVGLDASAVETEFKAFTSKYPTLTAQQLQFLRTIQQHIALGGGLEIDQLYQDPFTRLHPESVDGMFGDAAQVDDLLTILARFNAGELPAERAA